MSEDVNLPWDVLLTVQQGITSHTQALRAGFSRRQIEHKLTSGRWQRIYLGVYATFTGELTREAQLRAVVLRVGEGALLSHETAAELHKLITKPAKDIHVTVPGNRRPVQRNRLPGVIIHHTDRSLAQSLPVWQLPRTRVEDTILDLVAGSSSLDDAYAWISRGLSGKPVTAAMILDALNLRKKFPNRAWVKGALADAESGILFPLEFRYVRDVERAHGLPKPARQAGRVINGTRHKKDNLYEPYGVCVELDGLEYHWDKVVQDRHRDNVNLAEDDVRTFRFGWIDVTARSCDSAAMVANALRRGRWAGRPHPCRKPGCTVGRSEPGR